MIYGSKKQVYHGYAVKTYDGLTINDLRSIKMIGGSEQNIDKDIRNRNRNSTNILNTDDFTSLYLTQVAVNGGDFSTAGEANGEAFLLFAALVIVGFTAYWSGSVILNTLTRNPFCSNENFLRKRGAIPLQLTDNPGVYDGINLLFLNYNYKLNCLSGSALKSKSTGSLRIPGSWQTCKFRIFNFYLDRNSKKIICLYSSANRKPNHNSWQELIGLNDSIHMFVLDKKTPFIYNKGDKHITLYGDRIKGSGYMSFLRRLGNIKQLSTGKSYINLFPGINSIKSWIDGLSGLNILKEIIERGGKIPKWKGPLNYTKVGLKSIIPEAHNPTNWKLNLEN